MTIATYNLPSVVSGDRFDGVVFQINKNGSPLDLSSGSVVLTVYPLPGWPIVYSTMNNKMTITNATSGCVEFTKQIISMLNGAGNPYIGTFPYEATFYTFDGDVKTYVSGTWSILSGV